jgi:hypothetical protein
MCESTSDRRTQKEWLETITKDIRNNSPKICIIMFSNDPSKYEQEYNSISSNMIVYCVREYIDDDENKKNISKYLCQYFNIQPDNINNIHNIQTVEDFVKVVTKDNIDSLLTDFRNYLILQLDEDEKHSNNKQYVFKWTTEKDNKDNKDNVNYL